MGNQQRGPANRSMTEFPSMDKIRTALQANSNMGLATVSVIDLVKDFAEAGIDLPVFKPGTRKLKSKAEIADVIFKSLNFSIERCFIGNSDGLSQAEFINQLTPIVVFLRKQFNVIIPLYNDNIPARGVRQPKYIARDIINVYEKIRMALINDRDWVKKRVEDGKLELENLKKELQDGFGHLEHVKIPRGFKQKMSMLEKDAFKYQGILKTIEDIETQLDTPQNPDKTISVVSVNDKFSRTDMEDYMANFLDDEKKVSLDVNGADEEFKKNIKNMGAVIAGAGCIVGAGFPHATVFSGGNDSKSDLEVANDLIKKLVSEMNYDGKDTGAPIVAYNDSVADENIPSDKVFINYSWKDNGDIHLVTNPAEICIARVFVGMYASMPNESKLNNVSVSKGDIIGWLKNIKYDLVRIDGFADVLSNIVNLNGMNIMDITKKDWDRIEFKKDTDLETIKTMFIKLEAWLRRFYDYDANFATDTVNKYIDASKNLVAAELRNWYMSRRFGRDPDLFKNLLRLSLVYDARLVVKPTSTNELFVMRPTKADKYLFKLTDKILSCNIDNMPSLNAFVDAVLVDIARTAKTVEEIKGTTIPGISENTAFAINTVWKMLVDVFGDEDIVYETEFTNVGMSIRSTFDSPKNNLASDISVITNIMYKALALIPNVFDGGNFYEESSKQIDIIDIIHMEQNTEGLNAITNLAYKQDDDTNPVNIALGTFAKVRKIKFDKVLKKISSVDTAIEKLTNEDTIDDVNYAACLYRIYENQIDKSKEIEYYIYPNVSSDPYATRDFMTDKMIIETDNTAVKFDIDKHNNFMQFIIKKTESEYEDDISISTDKLIELYKIVITNIQQVVSSLIIDTSNITFENISTITNKLMLIKTKLPTIIDIIRNTNELDDASMNIIRKLINVIISSSDVLKNNNIDNVISKTNIIKKHETDTEEKVETLQKTYNEKKTNLDVAQAKVKAMNKTSSDAGTNLKKAENDLETTQRKRTAVRSDLATAKEILKTAKKEPAAVRKKRAAVRVNLEIARTNLATAEKALETARNNLTTAERVQPTDQGDLETAQGNLAAAQEELATAQGNLETAKEELATVEKELATAKEELATVEKELATAKKELATAQEELTTAQGNLAAAQEELATAQGNLATAQEELATAQGNLATAQGNLAAAQEELTTAQEEPTDLILEITNINDVFFKIISKKLTIDMIVNKIRTTFQESKTIVHNVLLAKTTDIPKTCLANQIDSVHTKINSINIIDIFNKTNLPARDSILNKVYLGNDFDGYDNIINILLNRLYTHKLNIYAQDVTYAYEEFAKTIDREYNKFKRNDDADKFITKYASVYNKFIQRVENDDIKYRPITNSILDNVKLTLNDRPTADNILASFKTLVESARTTFNDSSTITLIDTHRDRKVLLTNLDIAIPVIQTPNGLELDLKNPKIVYFADNYPILMSTVNTSQQNTVSLTSTDIANLKKYNMVPIGVTQKNTANLDSVKDYIYIRRRVNGSPYTADKPVPIGIVDGKVTLNQKITQPITTNCEKIDDKYTTLIISDDEQYVTSDTKFTTSGDCNSITGKGTNTITGMDFAGLMSGGGKIDEDSARAVVSDIRRYAHDLAERVSAIQSLFKLPAGSIYGNDTVLPFDAEAKDTIKSIASDSADFIKAADVMEKQVAEFKNSIVSETKDSTAAIAVIDSAWDEVSSIRDLLKSISTISFTSKTGTFFSGGEDVILNPIPEFNTDLKLLTESIPSSAAQQTTRSAHQISDTIYTRLLKAIVDANLLKSPKYDQNLVKRENNRSKILGIEADEQKLSTGDAPLISDD